MFTLRMHAHTCIADAALSFRAHPQYLLLAGTLSTLWLCAWAGILADLVKGLQRAKETGAAADAADGLADAVRETGLVPVLLLAVALVAIIIPLPERCDATRSRMGAAAKMCADSLIAMRVCVLAVCRLGRRARAAPSSRR